MFLEVSQLPLIKKATTARDRWSVLKAHEKATVSKRMLLLTKMCRIEVGEGGSLEKHMMEMEDLIAQLDDADQDLDELFKIAIILAS